MNVAPVGSVELKLNVALAEAVGFAGVDVVSSSVSGAPVSTVQV